MKQVILTNSCGYPHPLFQTFNKKELLQAKLDSGVTIENLMVDLECVFPADSKHYVRYETVQDFVDAMNNNDSTKYFTLLNLTETKEKTARLNPNTNIYIAVAGTIIGLAGIFITIFKK